MANDLANSESMANNMANRDSYKYRDTEKRRAYQCEYMRKKREALRKGQTAAQHP